MNNRINLLPWREEQRKRQNIEFGIVAGAAAVLTLALVLGIRMYFEDRISYHQQRNTFIQNEIKVLDSKLETIKGLEDKKQNLLDRMNVIQELQSSRPEVVHLFETLVTTIPDGIWLDSIKQSNKSITIGGKTESNARVSAFMRNLEESEWISSPTLQSIQTRSNETGASFQLLLSQSSPQNEEEE